MANLFYLSLFCFPPPHNFFYTWLLHKKSASPCVYILCIRFTFFAMQRFMLLAFMPFFSNLTAVMAQTSDTLKSNMEIRKMDKSWLTGLYLRFIHSRLCDLSLSSLNNNNNRMSSKVGKTLWNAQSSIMMIVIITKLHCVRMSGQKKSGLNLNYVSLAFIFADSFFGSSGLHTLIHSE